MRPQAAVMQTRRTLIWFTGGFLRRASVAETNAGGALPALTDNQTRQGKGQ